MFGPGQTRTRPFERPWYLSTRWEVSSNTSSLVLRLGGKVFPQAAMWECARSASFPCGEVSLKLNAKTLLIPESSMASIIASASGMGMRSFVTTAVVPERIASHAKSFTESAASSGV